jgi:hypothetical protein
LFNSKNILWVLKVAAITSMVVFMLSRTAAATNWPTVASLDLVKTTCATEPGQNPELIRLRDDISAADSVDEARTLALAPTSDAIDALSNARTIMPFSEDLRLAETRLSDARSRIEAADTPDQVADEFSGMMLAGLDNDRLTGVSVGKVSCNYSTGETIAIVIGLILGIIPGIILLIVLC